MKAEHIYKINVVVDIFTWITYNKISLYEIYGELCLGILNGDVMPPEGLRHGLARDRYIDTCIIDSEQINKIIYVLCIRV